MDAALTEVLGELEIEDFLEKAGGAKVLTATDNPTTMQINVGRKCNLVCTHCHLECGPNRTEEMSKEVMDACIKVFANKGFKIADITGGAPEYNENLQYLIESLAPIAQKVMVRTNLCILEEPEYAHFIDVYARNKCELIASLPCYTKEGAEGQRGAGMYEPAIAAFKKLNALGYGTDPELRINIVYNPDGAFLPPNQEGLRGDYAEYLGEHHGIVFNDLYAICNSPLGRFGQRLMREGKLESYIDELIATFNPATVPNIMCLTQLSVGYDGKLYDCDGHQAIGLPITNWNSIFDLIDSSLTPRVIKTAVNCFSCTAGTGSSCGGALTDDGKSSGECCCCG